MSRKVALIALISLAALATAPSLAGAEEAVDFGRTGGYVGGGLALGFDNFTGGGAGHEDFSTGVGLDLWAGYRMLSTVALEAQVEYLGRFDAGSRDTSTLAVTGNIKGYFSTGRLQPFGLAGLGIVHGKSEGVGPSDSGTGFAARIGAGLDYWLTSNISVGATYSYLFTTGGGGGLDYQSFVMGGQYRF
jgi:opacity protein-like surface antigen